MIFKKVVIVCCFLSLWLNAASDFPKNQEYSDYTAQNSGKTGIIEMPNARVMDDWRIRFNYHYNKPFMYYGLSMAPLPRLETNFRITQIQGMTGFGSWSNYGDYKDKAIDVKFLIAKEDDIFPAIAVGFDDITGTALFASKYLAFSKRTSFMDLTSGYAIGRMGGNDISEFYNMRDGEDAAMKFLKNMDFKGSFFAGVELHITPDFTLKAEYSPIDYMKDQVNAFRNGIVEKPSSKFNFGLTYNITNNSNISVNFERGNSVAFGYRMAFGFEKEGLYSHQPDIKWRANDNIRQRYEAKNDQELVDTTANEIAAERFANVDVTLKDNKMWIGFENPKYDTSAQALGRVADVVDEVVPQKIDTLYLALKNRNQEHSVVEINRQDIKYMKNNLLSSAQELENALEFSNQVNIKYDKFLDFQDDYDATSDTIGTKYISFIHRPHLQTFLNAKDNPIVYRLTWLAGFQGNFWDGMQLRTRFRIPIVNTMDQIADKTLEPEGSTTRTDVLKYQQYSKVQLNDLTFDQVFPFLFNSYGRVSAGYFEAAYAGYALEWYKPISNGRFGIGVEYTKVKKREVEDMLALKDQAFDTKFLNIYANLFPELGISTSLKIGQFLAGDKGARLTFAREYKGYTIGAYIAKTDTSIFKSQENRDYVDKGIFISIPLGLFTTKATKGSLGYGLSAWTRDVAQTVAQPNSLVGSDYGNIYNIKQNLGYFKE